MGEKFKENINSGSTSNEKLSEEEALLYQDYAVNLDKIKFDEKASDKSYEEAEILIKKLRDKKFDWLKIDWNKLDLENTKQYKEIEERLDAAVKQTIKSTKNSIIIKLLEKYKNITLPLALSVSLLLSFSPQEAKAENGLRMAEQTELKTQNIELPSFEKVIKNLGATDGAINEQLPKIGSGLKADMAGIARNFYILPANATTNSQNLINFTNDDFEKKLDKEPLSIKNLFKNPYGLTELLSAYFASYVETIDIHERGHLQTAENIKKGFKDISYTNIYKKMVPQEDGSRAEITVTEKKKMEIMPGYYEVTMGLDGSGFAGMTHTNLPYQLRDDWMVDLEVARAGIRATKEYAEKIYTEATLKGKINFIDALRFVINVSDEQLYTQAMQNDQGGYYSRSDIERIDAIKKEQFNVERMKNSNMLTPLLGNHLLPIVKALWEGESKLPQTWFRISDFALTKKGEIDMFSVKVSIAF